MEKNLKFNFTGLLAKDIILTTNRLIDEALHGQETVFVKAFSGALLWSNNEVLEYTAL